MKAKSHIVDAGEKSAPDLLQAQALAEIRLRDAAVRITTSRLKVLGALLEARCACSHQDMQDRFADMDRVTLYRALDCLTDAGLAHKIAGDDRVFRYSAGAERGEPAKNRGRAADNAYDQARHQHGHFKCTRCTKVFCLDGDRSAIRTSETARHQDALRRQLHNTVHATLGKGFQCHDIELTIKGWCADCTH